MKHHLLLVLALAGSTVATASTVHELRGVKYDVDTVAYYKAGPGMMHTRLRYQSQESTSKHFTANVLTIDLNNSPNLDLRMHLGCDSVHTSEKMTNVARRHQDDNNQYVACINGDFFITWASTPLMLGYPNMTACHDGQMAISDNVDHDNHIDGWIMDWQRGMWCDQTVLNNTATLPSGDVLSLYGVNFARRDDSRLDAQDDSGDFYLFNQYRGHYTHMAAGWTEVALELADGAEWKINSPVRLKVVAAPSTGGNMAITEGGAVLAAGPSVGSQIAGLQAGDEVTVNIGLTLPTFDNLAPDVKEVIGGDVTLLRNGEAVLTANRFINSRDSEYPRTMIGYDKDRTIFVMCTVDGKTAVNTGVSYPQGAELMRCLGCWDALDLDGGGSTMMWLEQEGFVNTPSDGSERAVGSGLFAVITSPKDDEVTEIRFYDSTKTIPQYGYYTPKVLAYNRYGQLIDMDFSDYTLSVPAGTVTVSDDGRSIMAPQPCAFALTATYGDATATIPVFVAQASEIALGYSALLIDNIHPVTIPANAVVDGELMPLDAAALAWNTTDAAVATIGADGTVTGLADGLTTIEATVGGQTATTTITVECPTGPTMPIESIYESGAWSVKGTSATATIDAVSNDGLEITHKVTSTRSPTVTLTPSTPIQLWSWPDALALNLTATGPAVSKIAATVTPNGARNTSVTGSDVALDQACDVTFDLTDLATSPAIYPITLQSITLTFGATGEGTIKVSGLDQVYNGFSGVESIPAVSPGAFNPNAPVEYYNLQGIRVTAPQSGQLLIRRQGPKASKIIF